MKSDDFDSKLGNCCRGYLSGRIVLEDSVRRQLGYYNVYI